MSVRRRLLFIGMGLWGGGAYSSEEIRIYEHDHMAGPANKQEAEEQHRQRACDVTFYWKRHYGASSIHLSINLFRLKSNRLNFLHCPFK